MKEDPTTKETEKKPQQQQESDQTWVPRWERQTPDTGSAPGQHPRPTPRPTSATCSQHPRVTPTVYTPDQMHTQTRGLMFLVEQLVMEMRQLASADTVEPEQWSSVALKLREVAGCSLLLRQRALELAAEALGLGHQTSGTLGLFEETFPPKEAD